ncbi:MAG: glycosyltransferase [Alicyclobacillus macrosporangiidus]|uniref:glycosyltransferase family protein n=1 Tax=Alicyclobacillus macrosporangiidus TaxID=392015 RepID=UPI0026F2FAE3|nr:glycosyltransferase [Alicyclobacillus macrosporangiidus]MCL6598313.1 glycosyltransferase [Alicyclobacillus macrosporangiidus]
MGSATVVITAAVPWDGTTARPHHFARGLAARGWDVLFVGAPVTLIAPLKNPALRSRLVPAVPVTEVPLGGTYDADVRTGRTGRLRVLAPFACLPFPNLYRTVNRWNQALLARQIEHAAPGPYVLLPQLPNSADLVPALHPAAVVYDCVDLHAGFSGLVRQEVVNQMEADLAAVSRTVVATAGALAEHMRALHPDVRLVPNAAEIDHFAAAASVAEHPRLAGIPRPRVALIGGFGHWVDYRFLRALAEGLPEVQFVMIGPVETDVSMLSALPNVHFLGLQPYRELPQYLAGCQAALVSFVNTDLTRSVNPIKVFEYLAAGKEVVATSTAEIDKLADYIWVARSPSEGLEMLRGVLAGARRCDDAKRQAFVQSNSWAARVQQVDQILRAALPEHLHPQA